MFYGGVFSQWYPSPFTIDGIEYDCAEQYMMAEKARVFYDNDSLAKIMATSDPRKQKALGRKIKGFKKEVWEQVAKRVVYRGNCAKFTQNLKLLTELFKTDGKTLVEASPYDCVWGIGLGENDPKAHDRSQWRGTNWLGEILTDLRKNLMAEHVKEVGVTGAEFETSLKETMTKLADSIKQDRRASEPYKDLFKAAEGNNWEGLLRKMEHQMMRVVLDGAQAIEDKTGKPIPKDIFDLLRLLPFAVDKTEQSIRKADGFTCCVDKTYWHLHNCIEKELNKFEKGE